MCNDCCKEEDGKIVHCSYKDECNLKINIMEDIQDKNQQEVYSMPRIGDTAPDFEAVTTKGKIKFSEFAKREMDSIIFSPSGFYASLYNRNEWIRSEKIRI